MKSPELIVLAINIIVILIAYFLVYPKYCGSDINKIAINDMLASGIPLLSAGTIFWGTGHEFSLLFFSVNWFWFTLLTYAIIEMPLMFWYAKKHNVWSSFKS